MSTARGAAKICSEGSGRKGYVPIVSRPRGLLFHKPDIRKGGR